MFTEKIFNKKNAIVAAAVAAVLLLGIYTSGIPASTYAADDVNQATKRVLNVSGQGTVQLAPDIAYVTMGLITENINAKEAQKANAETMSRVVSLLRSGGGIDTKDIQTVGYNISPKYDYNKDTGESKIIGYTVSNSIQVTVRDITKAGSIIDLASESGINLTSNISFGLKDYETAYNQALKSAVEIAEKHAETMAGALGITLKFPVSINESGYYAPVYNYAGDMSVKAEGATTPVLGGTIEVKATVAITYEY